MRQINFQWLIIFFRDYLKKDTFISSMLLGRDLLIDLPIFEK